MELIDYLRVAKSRAWILVLLPLLAGGAVAAVTLSKPKQYSANATIAAPALVGGIGANQYTGADGPKAFDSNFNAALTSPAIVNEVAQQTHVAAGLIKSGLTSAPLGSSTLGTSTILQVTYTTPHKATAAKVAETAASDVLQFLFKTQSDLAKANVASAQQTLDAAEAALTAFVAQTNVAQPDHIYDFLQQQINSLQVQQLQDQASGNTAAAAGLAASINAKQTSLKALAPQVQQYLALQDKKNAAIANLNQVTQSEYQSANQFQSADPASTITVSKATEVSRISGLVLSAGPAAAVGLFLAVGLIFLLELLSRRPSRTEGTEVVEQARGRDVRDGERHVTVSHATVE